MNWSRMRLGGVAFCWLSSLVLVLAIAADEVADQRLDWSRAQSEMESLTSSIRGIDDELKRQHLGCSGSSGAAEMAGQRSSLSEQKKQSFEGAEGRLHIGVELGPLLRRVNSSINDQTSRQVEALWQATSEINRRGGGSGHLGFLLASEVENWRLEVARWHDSVERLALHCAVLESLLVEIYPVVIEAFEMMSATNRSAERQAALEVETARLRREIEVQVGKIVEHTQTDFVTPLELVPARKIVSTEFPPPD